MIIFNSLEEAKNKIKRADNDIVVYKQFTYAPRVEIAKRFQMFEKYGWSSSSTLHPKWMLEYWYSITDDYEHTILNPVNLIHKSNKVLVENEYTITLPDVHNDPFRLGAGWIYSAHSKNEPGIWCKCFIPKGAYYCENEEEIASTSLCIYKKVLATWNKKCFLEDLKRLDADKHQLELDKISLYE